MPPTQNGLDQAREAATKVTDILGGILEIQLIEAGQLPMNRDRLKVGDLVRDAIRSFEGSTTAQGRTIVLEEASPRELSVDSKLVRRSVENLISNALKYSPSGSVVSVRVIDAPNGLAIEVHDRGPGVPDALKENLFEKFASVEAKTGRVRRGHGLGLYLVKLVATSHKGEVSVRDGPGGGSIFKLVLPVDSWK